MPRLLDFISHHPYLAGAALLAALVVVGYEMFERMRAFAGLSTAQAVRLINQGAIVVDLRNKDSFDAGHINEARNMPAADLDTQTESLKRWRDKNVITYCDNGSDGVNAARKLVKMGFTKVFNLQGGLNAWIKDNLPLAKTVPSGRGNAK